LLSLHCELLADRLHEVEKSRKAQARANKHAAGKALFSANHRSFFGAKTMGVKWLPCKIAGGGEEQEFSEVAVGLVLQDVNGGPRRFSAQAARIQSISA